MENGILIFNEKSKIFKVEQHSYIADDCQCKEELTPIALLEANKALIDEIVANDTENDDRKALGIEIGIIP